MFQVGYAGSMPNRPYSSMSGGYGGGQDPLAHDPLGLDNSQSYLGAEGGGMGSVLRDTAISGYDNDDSNRARILASHRFVRVTALSCVFLHESHMITVSVRDQMIKNFETRNFLSRLKTRQDKTGKFFLHLLWHNEMKFWFDAFGNEIFLINCS